MRPICVKMLLSPWSKQHAGDGRQQAHRHDEDDRERQREALVLRGEHQEDEQHAQREDQQRGVAGR